MTIIYRGSRLLVAEGQDGAIEFRIGKHRVTPKAKTFKPACKEGMQYMLDNAGDMKGNYERSEA